MVAQPRPFPSASCCPDRLGFRCTKNEQQRLADFAAGSRTIFAATRRARPRSSSTGCSKPSATRESARRGRSAKSGSKRPTRRNRLRRSGLEAGRADRDETARRRPAPPLPAGVRLLDPAGARPAALCRLCNFDEFWVYDFETQMDTPVDQVGVEELPKRYGPLAFLFPNRRNAQLRQRSGGSYSKGRRPAGHLLQQVDCPKDRSGPLRSGSCFRCWSPCSPRTSG